MQSRCSHDARELKQTMRRKAAAPAQVAVSVSAGSGGFSLPYTQFELLLPPEDTRRFVGGPRVAIRPATAAASERGVKRAADERE